MEGTPGQRLHKKTDVYDVWACAEDQRESAEVSSRVWLTWRGWLVMDGGGEVEGREEPGQNESYSVMQS